jgi:heterodisulfide reductase subunit C/nitrate reductase gamma subunit
MFFDVALYTSLIVFGLGTLYKVSTWFRRGICLPAEDNSAATRARAALSGILRTVLSAKILTLLKVLLLDVVLQLRVLKEDFGRWIMHMLLYGAFVLLLLFHAMDGIITIPLFPEYASTLNPFMFLRDLLGALVIVGIGIAVSRRIVMKVPRLKTNPMDVYAIVILAVIMFSGVFLEGVKITSRTSYLDMVAEWSDTDDEEELQALESYWVAEYEVVSPDRKGPFDEEILALGAEIHEMSCAACHSPPASAFTGYVAAKVTKPFARALDRANAPAILWYIHILACFVGLAYLPFSKMFHILASPISLLANAVMDKKNADPANIATRQIMELDACTHCGTCSRRCSVAVAYRRLGNLTILPSEKMVFLKKYVAHKDLALADLKSIQEGAYLCTNCDRCTVVCPVGINLRDLWFNVKEEMIQYGPPVPLVLSPFSFYRGVDRAEIDPRVYAKPLDGPRRAIAASCELIDRPEAIVSLTKTNRGFRDRANLFSQAGAFANCYACENCTTVCPVVQNYENPQEVLGMLPHQIMRSLGLGLKDLALGSGMLWDCVTCYQCQEHCPQGVKVTDVLYELKNLALKEAM